MSLILRTLKRLYLYLGLFKGLALFLLLYHNHYGAYRHFVSIHYCLPITHFHISALPVGQKIQINPPSTSNPSNRSRRKLQPAIS